MTVSKTSHEDAKKRAREGDSEEESAELVPAEEEEAEEGADDAREQKRTKFDAAENEANTTSNKVETAKGEQRSWKPQTLGPKTFNSPEEAIKYFSWLLNTITPNQDMNDYERLVVQACLEKVHGDFEKKVGCGIKAFQVKMHPEHDSKCYYVMRTNGSMTDFSYRKCVEGVFPGWDKSNATKAESKPKNTGRGGGGRGGGRGRRH